MGTGGEGDKWHCWECEWGNGCWGLGSSPAQSPSCKWRGFARSRVCHPQAAALVNERAKVRPKACSRWRGERRCAMVPRTPHRARPRPAFIFAWRLAGVGYGSVRFIVCVRSACCTHHLVFHLNLVVPLATPRFHQTPPPPTAQPPPTPCRAQCNVWRRCLCRRRGAVRLGPLCTRVPLDHPGG